MKPGNGGLIMINYGFTKEIDASFEETLDKVSNELEKEGFGTLTQINVRVWYSNAN
jgi:uncharacterized protein (DUF302 family)